MNNIVKNAKGVYELTTIAGAKFDCKTWTETKGDKKNLWVVLPKEAVKVTGRTYISQKLIDDAGATGYSFADKTTGPRTIGSRLTEEAQKKVADLEAQIKAIKADPANIVAASKVDPNSEEGLEAAIKRHQAKLEALRAAKQAPVAPAADTKPAKKSGK